MWLRLGPHLAWFVHTIDVTVALAGFLQKPVLRVSLLS